MYTFKVSLKSQIGSYKRDWYDEMGSESHSNLLQFIMTAKNNNNNNYKTNCELKSDVFCCADGVPFFPNEWEKQKIEMTKERPKTDSTHLNEWAYE